MIVRVSNHIIVKPKEHPKDRYVELIEKILQPSNITMACREVVCNKGAGGVDGMKVSELEAYLHERRTTLTAQIRSGDYHAHPIRGKEVPKGGGKMRLLGIPTAFDKVNHVLLLQLLYRKIKCKTTMRLIRRWLRIPLEKEGELIKRRMGVPQGSPVSPLLSNIILHEPDTEMERLGLCFVRHADDFSIYSKTN